MQILSNLIGHNDTTRKMLRMYFSYLLTTNMIKYFTSAFQPGFLMEKTSKWLLKLSTFYELNCKRIIKLIIIRMQKFVQIMQIITSCLWLSKGHHSNVKKNKQLFTAKNVTCQLRLAKSPSKKNSGFCALPTAASLTIWDIAKINFLHK